jgi:hypothetical protein
MRFTEVENIINNVSNVKNYDKIEGRKIRLNYKNISKDKTYDFKPNTYKEFITTNRDTILHIEPNQYYKNFVSLVEDTNNPKWLFNIEDLIEVNE